MVKDIFAALKIMGLPRANKLFRSALGVGPAVPTVKSHVRQLAKKYQTYLYPGDSLKRIQRAANLWKPIIEEKLAAGEIGSVDVIPVTSGADATPVPSLPQYCPRRNIIVGLCGPVAPGHKCSLDPPQQIQDGEAGFNQIVSLIRTQVWSSYVYAHILQPQVGPHTHAYTYMHIHMHIRT